jgi:hypothetical protein
MTYIIIRKILSENVIDELKTIIMKLKKIKFPKYYEEKKYEIEEWK